MELLIEPFSKRRAQARGSRTYCGLVIDAEYRLAFVAYEENARMAVFDLEAKKMATIHSVGAEPDVLAFDRGLRPPLRFR